MSNREVYAGEVQGPINREPEEKMDPESKKGSSSPTGIRRLYVLDSNNLIQVDLKLLDVEKNVFDCWVTRLAFQSYYLDKNLAIASNSWRKRTCKLEVSQLKNSTEPAKTENIPNFPKMADDNNEKCPACNIYPNIIPYTTLNWNFSSSRFSVLIFLLNVYYLLICVYSYNKSYLFIELLGRLFIWSLRLTSTLTTPFLKCCFFTSIFYFNFNVCSSPYHSLMKLMGTGS